MRIKDSFMKEWQGYHYSRSCMVRYAIRSVENNALLAFNGSLPDLLVLRTDNGPLSYQNEFRNAMKLLGIKLEYKQKHTPKDNGNIESFHNSIKTEYIWPYEFRDFHEASIGIKKAFIDYSECRPHSPIDLSSSKGVQEEVPERFEKKEVEVTLDENCGKVFQILVEQIIPV